MKKYFAGVLSLVALSACAVQTVRQSAYPVDQNILSRRSLRALSIEKITERQLMTLFEAARWAPSSYNDQPWKFLYAWRDSDSWKSFFDLLVPFNQSWAQNASVLVLVISRKNFDVPQAKGHPSTNHSFDAGAATQNMALQAHSMGLVFHVMGGFDAERARTELGIPEDYAIDAMIAIGKPGAQENLPEYLRSAESPSERKPLSEIIHEGSWEHAQQ